MGSCIYLRFALLGALISIKYTPTTAKIMNNNELSGKNPACSMPGSGVYPECQKTTKVPTSQAPTQKTTTRPSSRPEEDDNINYFGVAFAPYTKYGNPRYDTYDLEDVKIQLRVLNKDNRHNAIATYGAGAADYNQNGCRDGLCFVARAAGEINRDRNSVVITMAEGIRRNENWNQETVDREIRWAFNQSLEANRLQPGTIWALVFTNEYVQNQETGNQVLTMIRDNRDRARSMNLKVGTRVNRCDQMYTNGELKGILSQIIAQSDFIMCNIYPNIPPPGGHVTPQEGLRQVQEVFTRSRKEIIKVKNDIDVQIGETGWASEGYTFFNSDPQYHTVENMRIFWDGMKSWARDNQVHVHMFEAIDEPDKSSDPNNGENHFGWWYRARDNSQVYYEKTTQQQFP